MTVTTKVALVLAAVVGAILIAAGLFGGKGNPPPPPWPSIFDRFGVPLQLPPEESPENRPPLDLYVDDSQSMRGFVAERSASFARVLREILNRSATAHYQWKVYRFSGQVESVQSMILSQLLDEGFYSGVDTPLAALLDRVSKHEFHCSLIVTDLLQSERMSDHLALIDALKRTVAGCREVRLLAFRSSFHGTYFCETYPGGEYRLDLRETPGPGRPFYVLVVAPSRIAMAQLHRYVLRGLGESESFAPTEPPVRLTRVDYLPLKSSWIRAGDLQVGGDSGDSTRVSARFIEGPSAAGDFNPLRLRFTAEVRLPVLSARDFAFRVHGCRPAATEPKLQPLHVEAQGNLDSSEFTVLYTFPRSASRTWDVYRIEVAAGEGNLAVPPWVTDWNTEDDLGPLQASRTLHLSLLVHSMVRELTERVTFADLFILLGRGAR